ncbi:partial two-component system, sensor histidine kinase ChiS, partial [Planctomycetaceae bacterium]
MALENRRLFQDVEARVNELTVLTRISRRLASTLELDEVLSLIVDESISATQARQASIALYNEAENALEVRVMRGYTPEMEQAALGTLIRPGQGLHGRLLTTGRAVLVADVKLDTDYRAVNSDTRSEFIVPIRQGDLLLGALNLESPKAHAFADTDVRLIEALADQVAVAITNARAYEAERQAVERMREVDRLKTQFLANMSHELRTPLNSIIGFSRVILRGIDGPISELQQTDLTSIYNSGQHLLSLINNILDLSKIEAGKMELSIEPLDLRDIAKSVMSTAIALVKDKTVRLNQEVPDDLPTVMADQTRVRQIMLNLVSNAAKFTEKGSITLRVKTYPKEVYISVTDTGIGVADDKLEHIFEEFTQADASTTRRYGGTGLGLAITKKFVEMHKGRIWVESQVGVGSTFTFTLPREQPMEEPE